MIRRNEIERLRVDNLSISTSLLVRAAMARGIKYQILPYKLVLLSDGTHSRYLKGTLVDFNSEVSNYIANNKYLTRHLLRMANIPTPRTIQLRNPAAWSSVLSSRLQFPLVVKPIGASHGHGSTMNIKRKYELKRAVYRAFAFMKKKDEERRALVEEYFEGKDLRFLVLDGKVISIVERDPAYVVGNGRDTIKALIETFNADWESPIAYDFPLCPIPFDAETTRRLAADGRKLTNIPAQGQKVYVRWNANVSTGGRAIDITGSVHPELCTLAVRACEVAKIPFAGIDMLVKDYTISDSTANNLVVLEINNSPGLDLNQLPFKGTGRDVAGAIIDKLFPK